MTLWEYAAFFEGVETRKKQDVSNCILTGYYASYYTNGGKKAKNPNELILKLFEKKQSEEEGLKQIQKIKLWEKQQGGK